MIVLLHVAATASPSVEPLDPRSDQGPRPIEGPSLPPPPNPRPPGFDDGLIPPIFEPKPPPLPTHDPPPPPLPDPPPPAPPPPPSPAPPSPPPPRSQPPSPLPPPPPPVLSDLHCPCLTEWPAGVTLHKGLLEVTGVNGETAYYPADYGLMECKSHDLGLSLSCAADEPPQWCSDEWCYVEDGCNVAHSPSGFVVNANLSYSYARCGANDNYLFDMVTRTESVPLILDVQPAWVLPVAIVLSFLGGCATFALVSLLVSRCRAARSDAQAARAREKPSLADQDAVAVACGSNRASAASCSRRSSHYQMRSSQHDTRASL